MLLLNRDKNSGGWGDDRRIHLTSKFTSKVYPTIKKKKKIKLIILKDKIMLRL